MTRSMSLRLQLLVLQLVIVLVTVVTTGLVAAHLIQEQIRDAHKLQMVAVAQSVATLPTVLEAFDDADPATTIQPIAEVIREASGVTYVVVTDAEGIRYSHTNPDRIGERVSTDPSIPLSGETYVGTQTGTLGTSWRVKMPVHGDDDSVIGTASVGTLEEELTADFLDDLPTLMVWLVGAAIVGTLGATWVAKLFSRRTHRLEPDEITELLETREAMLHGIGEGVVAVDTDERVVLVNDEATRLLGVGPDSAGSPADTVLEPDIVALLRATDDDGQADRLVLSGERVLLARRNPAKVDGSHVGVVLILRDRTELHAVLRDLDGARDLTQALRAQAHEFANRMHIVSGLLELGRADDAVDFIQRSGDGGALLSGPLGVDITDPDVTALLLAKIATARELGVRVRVDPDSVVEPDGTTDVVTVVGNLLDNAIDATGPGGDVDVCFICDDGLIVQVADDGHGVPPEDRGRIFTAGVTTRAADAVGTAGGAARGIGLALVSRIVARRRGTVTVVDGENGGAVFTVFLPVLHQESVGPESGQARVGVALDTDEDTDEDATVEVAR